ncbi:hypothetical protein V0288_11775 [Pannus brasiliensis CCIBt3594]|uniref:DUF488 domain-containing protein n=1 Tax=Pannus brasiliensis CCIBt3594 TaxID=1427578 RepID=A0AAW9QW99_9CHRO
MIYTASYFEPHRHHGKRLSISRTAPKGFKLDGRLEFFVPSAGLLEDWKNQKIGEEEYTARYREQIKANLPLIQTWIARLDPAKDMTLLCWERSGIDETLKRWEETGKWQEERHFCHRNLAIQFVRKYRPDCYGGTDILKVDLPLCHDCLTEVIPAVMGDTLPDSCFCPKCRKWTKKVLYPENTTTVG